MISEKYVRAGLYLTSGDKTNSKILLEEIILSKNKFYSVLALNKILEKNLVEDKNKINEYFIILDTIKFNDENKDLIIFKKALYLIKNNETETGNKLLKKLIKKGSYLKPKIEEIIEN